MYHTLTSPFYIQPNTRIFKQVNNQKSFFYNSKPPPFQTQYIVDSNFSAIVGNIPDGRNRIGMHFGFGEVE
jgi:hypothetical protein